MRFKALSDAGFAAALLPIIPPGAKMHSDFASLQGGKTPGIFFDGAWAPKKDWLTIPPDTERWDRWRCGAGLRSRGFPAVDIDVLDKDYAEFIERFVEKRLGLAPVRIGQAPKRLLVYRLEGLPFGKRSLKLGTLGTVEILGDGQQYVVDGIHPRTGKPYYWVNGHNLLNLGAKGLTAVSAEQVDKVLEDLADWAEIMGLEADLTGSGATGVVGNRPEALHGPNMAAVAGALAAIGNDLDYDGWIVLGRAVKAACAGFAELGLEDGFEMWTAWSAGCVRKLGADVEKCRYHWDSFHPPHRVGWHHLAALARGAGFNDAALEFEVVEVREKTPAVGAAGASALVPSLGTSDLSLDEVLMQWVWVEKIECLVEIETGIMLNRTQFNMRFAKLGNPNSVKNCAWARTVRDHRLKQFRDITYRPAGPRILREGHDLCLNVWQASGMLSQPSSAADVRLWLEHLDYLIPDARERSIVLQFLALLAQRLDVKINWALVMKSEQHGVGKDMLIQPLKDWVGMDNVSIIKSQNVSDSTYWLARRKLVVLEEVHTFDRRETMQSLKSYIAAPPNFIPVNEKYKPQYQVPNIVTFIIFTNQPDALAIERSDRRLFVVDCDVEKKDPAYYGRLAAWYEAGGAAQVIGYLQSVELANFEPKGNAPDTAAKQRMITATRSQLESWIADHVQDHIEPFNGDLVALSEIRQAMPRALGEASYERLAITLRRLGAVGFEQFRLPKGVKVGGTDRVRVFAVRDGTTYSTKSIPEIRECFLAQKGETLREEFGRVLVFNRTETEEKPE